MTDTNETPTTETEATVGARSQLPVHEGQVQYLREQGVDVDNLSPAEVIAAAYATRNAWRKTDAYRTVKAGLTEAREAEAAERKAAREAAKAEKAKEREAKKAEKAKRAEAKGTEQVMKEQPKKARRKVAKDTAEDQTDEAGSEDGDEDNPFSE